MVATCVLVLYVLKAQWHYVTAKPLNSHFFQICRYSEPREERKRLLAIMCAMAHEVAGCKKEEEEEKMCLFSAHGSEGEREERESEIEREEKKEGIYPDKPESKS